MYRLPTELETLEAYEILEAAIADRRVVDLSYFKTLRDARGYTRYFKDSPWLMRLFGRREMLSAAPVRRIVEPVALEMSREGKLYATVISYASPGEERPASRTIRLDRVAVGKRGMRLRVTGRPFKVAGTALDPTLERV